MFSIVRRTLVAPTVAVLAIVIVGLGFGYFYQTSDGTSTASSPNGVTTGAADVIIESAINSSSACSQSIIFSLGIADWENTTAMNSLRSNVMGQPEFKELAQNRSYVDDGYSCSLVNGTDFTIRFVYNDMAHPFHVCGNGTAYPMYFIEARIYLMPTGYDLSRTTYSTGYYDSQNLTVTCTTTTS